jgi:choline dehydrogenase-like flavoprotein
MIDNTLNATIEKELLGNGDYQEFRPIFNHKQRQVLVAIAQTFIPDLPLSGNYPITLVDLVIRLEKAYSQAIDETAQQELKLLLTAFENGFFNGLLSGKWSPFTQMPINVREKVLYDWANSRFFTRRKAFQAFKRLTLFLGYGNPATEKHPLWQVIHYNGGYHAPKPEPHPITHYENLATQTQSVLNPQQLTCDVLVIGSGAGGGVVAAELSQVGLDVLVVEKGAHYPEEAIHGNELIATEKMYERFGALTTKDTALMVLAGSTLGGGTTINWAGSLRTPQNVLEEWARDYGFTDATSTQYQASLDAVSKRMNVNSDECAANANNAKFVKGCEALGLPVEVIPRNVKGCEDCGFCNFGCKFNAKQGTATTYLQDAQAKGARILTRAIVKRVTHERGVATGAILQVYIEGKGFSEVTVKANAVVVCGGSVNTPAILKRSGLTNPHVGGNLHLHPATVIFSIFDDPIRTWEGAPMTRVSKKYNNLDGKGYGFILEVAPAHPALTASTLPWRSTRNHQYLLNNMEYMGNVLCIVRDFHGGRVEVDKQGQPILNYRIHPFDRAHLQKGIIEALRVHQAAGAKEIYSPHNTEMRFVNDGKSSFDDYLKAVEQRGLEPNDFPLFSAHQMSSCRIGGNASLGAIKPNAETYEIKRLFVADASALPTATGVNPMLSIIGMVHYLSQQIKAELGK